MPPYTRWVRRNEVRRELVIEKLGFHIVCRGQAWVGSSHLKGTYKSRPDSDADSTTPRCLKARGVAERPRGVRSRNPSWIRYGS